MMQDMKKVGGSQEISSRLKLLFKNHPEARTIVLAARQGLASPAYHDAGVLLCLCVHTVPIRTSTGRCQIAVPCLLNVSWFHGVSWSRGSFQVKFMVLHAKPWYCM